MLGVKEIEKYISGRVKFENGEYKFYSFLPLQYACYSCDLCCRGDFLLTNEEKQFFKTNNITFFEACPFLKNKKCSIYEKRPIRCKNFPIQVSFSSEIELWVSFACPHAFEGKLLNENEIAELIKDYVILYSHIGIDAFKEMEEAKRIQAEIENRKNEIENFIDIEKSKKGVADIVNLFLSKGFEGVFELVGYKKEKEKDREILKQTFQNPRFFFSLKNLKTVKVEYQSSSLKIDGKEADLQKDLALDEDAKKIISFYFLAQFSRVHWYEILNRVTKKLLQKQLKPDMLSIWFSFLANQFILLYLCLQITAAYYNSKNVDYQIAREACALNDWILLNSTISKENLARALAEF
ncbi:MAG: YkgJ family cysteine cluster protein [Candidatus Micrarchaeia archaeon]